MTALVAIGLFVGTVLAWTNQRLWLRVSRSWVRSPWSASSFWPGRRSFGPWVVGQFLWPAMMKANPFRGPQA
jgi:hypothetical protein